LSKNRLDAEPIPDRPQDLAELEEELDKGLPFQARSGYHEGARRRTMFSTYTAKYTKIKSGYMGQLVKWPEVVTEGKTLEDCRAMLQDALREMILAYRQQKKEIPIGGAPLEQIPAKV